MLVTLLSHWNHQCKSTKSLKVTSLAECDLGFNLSYTSHNSISNDRRGPLFWEMTLPETNIFAPEKGLPKKETSSSNHWFSRAFAVSFREGTCSSWWFQPIWKYACQIETFPQIGMRIKTLWNPPAEKITKKNLWNWSMASPIPTNWGKPMVNWLVVSTQLKNMSQNGNLSQFSGWK